MAHDSRRGWIVTAAATAMGLLLGILYVWSVIKAGIPDSWGWSNAEKALPYSVACMVFALTMVPAGRLQDRLGPRGVATLGGVVSGLGCIVSGLSGSSITGFVIGFGLLTGVGIGFGYSAMTPAAIKWFPPRRTGLVAGIVVAGFGLASVYIAPLASWMLRELQTTTPSGEVVPGVSRTMIVIGTGILVLAALLAQLVRNPPQAASASGGALPGAEHELGWREMLRTRQFWVLYIMYFCGAGAGLMFISVAQDLGKRALGEWAFLAVVVLALGNASGRVLAGLVSDRIGRPWTLFGEFVLQALVVAVLHQLSLRGGGWPLTLLVVACLGMNYGANLTLFPAACKDYYGLKSFGLNYGLLFTAWGAAGLVLPWINGQIKDATGKTDLAYFIIIGMMLLAAGLSLVSRRLGKPAPNRAASAPASV